MVLLQLVSISLGFWIFPCSCMTPTATISTCDGREKNSHVTGYTDIEFMIRVGWVGLQSASYLILTTDPCLLYRRAKNCFYSPASPLLLNLYACVQLMGIPNNMILFFHSNQPTETTLRFEMCLWINTIYPLLQCQSSRGSVGRASD